MQKQLFCFQIIRRITSDEDKLNCSMNTYYIANSTDKEEKLLIPLDEANNRKTRASAPSDAVWIKSDQKVIQRNFNVSEFMEIVQAERKATLKEACRRLRDKSICPSKIKLMSKSLLYSKNYKVCFLLTII